METQSHSAASMSYSKRKKKKKDSDNGTAMDPEVKDNGAIAEGIGHRKLQLRVQRIMV